MIVLFFYAANLLGGWLVNLAADAVPAGRPFDSAQGRSWQRSWRLPLQAVGIQRASDSGAAEGQDWRTLRHVLVWIATAGLNGLAVIRFGLSWQALLVSGIACFLLAIAVIDLEHHLVLNRMLLASLPLVLFSSLVAGWPAPIDGLTGASVGFGLFLLIALAGRGAMGMGDVKLAAWIGMVTGFPGVLQALLLAIVAGGVAAFVLLVMTRFQRGRKMAYAPYLVLGAWVTLFSTALF